MDTGKTDVVRYSVFQDAGKAIHPAYVENQMQGGAAQGIGWALNEEYFMNDDGSMANFSFLDYRMPTSLDLPDAGNAHRRGSKPDAPVWCARRWRGADRTSARSHTERHQRCCRCSLARATDEAGSDIGRALAAKNGG